MSEIPPETNEERAARYKRQKEEREAELRRVPHQEFDRSTWPPDVRPISISETGGIGIDRSGRLHWDGKPVEIVGSRLDLTRGQRITAIVVASATVVAALATGVQAWTAYDEWACKRGLWTTSRCDLQKPKAAD